MNLGTENRKKTIAALALGSFALVMVIYRILSPTGGSPSAAAVPASPPAAQAALDPGITPAARLAARKIAPSKKPRVVSLYPTLRLGLLQSAENVNYTGNGRNIFRAQAEVIPVPIAPAVKNPVVVNTGPPPPPPPPPINLKFFGFASKPGEPKKVFLSQGEDVFIAGEGEIVDRRYKILRITPTFVEVEDVLNNNHQNIPLTQG